MATHSRSADPLTTDCSWETIFLLLGLFNLKSADFENRAHST